MHMGGTTLTWAIDAALEKGRTVAAQLLQPEKGLAFADGHFVCDFRAVRRARAGCGGGRHAADFDYNPEA